MAHGTRINGTQKSVTKGFTRVGGVQKKITKGLTRVAGVQRDVEFAGKKFNVKVTGSVVYNIYAKVTIAGVTYNSGDTANIEVEAGEIAHCWASTNSSYSLTTIYLNGVAVVSENQATYDHEITSDTEIKLVSSGFKGEVFITTS